MKVEDILGSPAFVALGIAIAKLLPSRFGRWLSRTIAHGNANKQRHLFRAVRKNIAHVWTEATSEELDRMAEATIAHAGYTYFDMFHTSIKDYRSGRATITVDPVKWQETLAILRDSRGTVIIGPHVSNYDLAAQWIASHDIKIQALSLSRPNAGTRTLNALRQHRGIRMTPIDVPSLREALERLRAGGVIMTGADRPASMNDDLLPFFGRPAPMPVGHVRLALQTHSRVIGACCTQNEDGSYALHISEPLEMEHVGSKQEDVRHNTLRTLTVMEQMIRIAPGQWIMFVPVWPEDLQD